MDEYQDIKNLLKPCRQMSASTSLRHRIDKAMASVRQPTITSRWQWAAAACVAVVIGYIAITAVKTGHQDCIVYVSGQRVSQNQALEIAENDVARMQQFMLVVAQQRTQEEEKVKQFVQHNTPSR